MQQGDQRPRLPIPMGLKDILEDCSAVVLRHQPPNIYPFLADYLEARLLKQELGGDFGKALADLEKSANPFLNGELSNKGDFQFPNAAAAGNHDQNKSGLPFSQTGSYVQMEENRMFNEQQRRLTEENRRRLPVETAVRRPSRTTAKQHVDHVLTEALELLDTLEAMDNDLESQNRLLNSNPMQGRLNPKQSNKPIRQASRESQSSQRGTRDPNIETEEQMIYEIQELKGQVEDLRNHVDGILGIPHQKPGTLQDYGQKGGGIDPATGQPYRVAERGSRGTLPFEPLQDRVGNQWEGGQIDPRTGQPYQGGIDSVTGLPPRLGQSRSSASQGQPGQIDPKTGQPYRDGVDPATGLPLRPGQSRISANQGQVGQIDPNTGQPYGDGIDPVTGLPIRPGRSGSIASQGQAGQIDPKTGKPYQGVIDSVTGLPVRPGQSRSTANQGQTGQIDPKTGQPYRVGQGSGVDPATGLPPRPGQSRVATQGKGGPIASSSTTGRGVVGRTCLSSCPSAENTFQNAIGDLNQRIADFWKDNVSSQEWASAVQEFSSEQIHVIKKLLAGEMRLTDAPAQTAFLAISFLIGMVLGYKMFRSMVGGDSRASRLTRFDFGPTDFKKCRL